MCRLMNYCYICCMKHFKAVSITFIIIIAVIFGCNVFYLVNLYASIRATVEKDVMSALADADLDELWIRANYANGEVLMQADSGNDTIPRHGELSAGINNDGTMVAESRVNGEVVSKQTLETDKDFSFSNLFSQTIGRQLHAMIDRYVPANLAVMDSVLTERLNNRYIFPGYVSTQVVDGNGNVIIPSDVLSNGDYDEFSYCFNPEADMYYRLYITPLTRHIISEMSGVVITVFLLMFSFALAFWYLFHTVSKLRTIEEMKDDFVSNMTHELKTPLAVAYSANDALLNYDTGNDAVKREQYLRIANRQLKLLRELVENILALSMERRKTMKLKMESIQLSPFIEDIAEAQRMRSDKVITINVETHGDVTVLADRTHLSNILGNLIDNAIKYSGDEVNILIKCDASGICVVDNGIGIPAKALPYLFNKFYRVPRGNLMDVRGYGIGLYYVKSILDRMGWKISVKSIVNEGSEFIIRFSGNE